MTVHRLDLPAVEPDASQRRRGRWTMLLVLAACAAPVVLSYFMYFVVRPDGRTNYATLIEPVRPMPDDLPLTGEDGRPVAPSSLKGQWLLVVVAGGACDQRCEEMLYMQRQLREMTGREQGRVDRVWLVPDDAPIRAPIDRAMHTEEGVAVLRVPRAALSQWLVPSEGQALEDELYLVDPMGDWMMRTPPQPDPKRFYGDLNRLLRASSFWDREGRGAP